MFMFMFMFMLHIGKNILDPKYPRRANQLCSLVQTNKRSVSQCCFIIVRECLKSLSTVYPLFCQNIYRYSVIHACMMYEIGEFVCAGAKFAVNHPARTFRSCSNNADIGHWVRIFWFYDNVLYFQKCKQLLFLRLSLIILKTCLVFLCDTW